jgi:putative FmdB family regulatory protein
MPIYEYRCEKCGDFEEMQRITDPPLARCPKCRAKIRRLISSTSFQLKGSGWYVTDYARSGANGSKDKAGGTDAGSGGESKSAGTSEAKESKGSKDSKASKPPASSSEKSTS